MKDLSTSQTITDDFFGLPIIQRGNIYEKSYFDEVNSKLLFEQLKETDDSKDDLTLVTPEDPTVLLTVVVESLLALLKYDVINGSNNTLKDIKPGDAVGLIENREMHPGVFEGTEFQSGKLKYYCIKQPNGITTKIPPGREWRIQPYSSAESLSPRRKVTVYGKELEEMLELPVGGLKAFQKSKMIVVAPDKSRLITAIRDVRIGGDPLEAVFPVADYTSAKDWHYVGSFGLNNLKQEPLISLVTNCDIAVDIAMKDPNHKLLLVDGASKLRAHYGSIERLNADNNTRKVLCLLRPTDEDEIKTLHSMGIESYIWKRDDFKNINLESAENADSPFSQHNQILYNLSGNDPSYLEVPLPTSIDEAVNDTYRLLRSLSRKVPSLPESGILIRWGISILNSWLQLPLTIDDYDSYLRENNVSAVKLLSDKFTDFKTRIRASYGLFIPSMNKNECEEMISKLEIIYKYFLNNNPKKDRLLSIVGRNTQDTFYVYCCQSGYTSAFNNIYGSNTRQAKNIEQLSVTPVGKAIVTGWSSRRNTAHGFLAPVRDLTFLLYRKELSSLRYIYRTHPASPESTYDINTRITLGSAKEISPATPVESLKDESIESILEYVSSKFNTPLYPSYEASNDKPDIIEAQQILFEDGSIVYADVGHKLDKIDRSARRIQRIKAGELVEGDEIVFADSERSMFEELLSILQKSDEYRNVSSVANIWREALKDYVEKNNVSDQELVAMFKMVGCPRTIHTIRSWLKGNVIGPSYDNYSAVGAIAKITRNANLETKHDEVIRACKTLHALHVKTGWLLVRNIINSAIEPEDSEDINQETRERLQAYSGSAKLKVIKALSEGTFSVPVNEVGQLHEAYL